MTSLSQWIYMYIYIHKIYTKSSEKERKKERDNLQILILFLVSYLLLLFLLLLYGGWFTKIVRDAESTVVSIKSVTLIYFTVRLCYLKNYCYNFRRRDTEHCWWLMSHYTIWMGKEKPESMRVRHEEREEGDVLGGSVSERSHFLLQK